MKTYWGVEVYFHAFVISVLDDECYWWTSHLRRSSRGKTASGTGDWVMHVTEMRKISYISQEWNPDS
jgi:hypothetical protein